MKVLRTAALTSIVIAAVVVLALDPASGAGTEANLADCSQATIGRGRPTWRSESVVAGPVGVNGEAMKMMSRLHDGDLVNKMPLLVEGEGPVTVSVPRVLRERVFLYYGRLEGRDGKPTHSFAESPGTSETKFEPCAGKPRTVWGGGLRVKGTAPVRLLVYAGNGANPVLLHLARPQVYEPKG
jgi:hypothetical protein